MSQWDVEKKLALDKANVEFRRAVVAQNELTKAGSTVLAHETVLIDGTERPNGLPENVDLTESRWW